MKQLLALALSCLVVSLSIRAADFNENDLRAARSSLKNTTKIENCSKEVKFNKSKSKTAVVDILSAHGGNEVRTVENQLAREIVNSDIKPAGAFIKCLAK